jgi:hypothetical protein
MRENYCERAARTTTDEAGTQKQQRPANGPKLMQTMKA